MRNLRKRLARTLRAFAWWILATVHPPQDEIDAALVAAFRDAGLPQDACHDDFDLARSGKLHEVLYHASHRLGNPLTTMRNLRDLLSE